LRWVAADAEARVEEVEYIKKEFPTLLKFSLP
jgi:hypothetical protein